MKKKTEYERIREVAKKLFSPRWVRDYGGADTLEAARRLSERFGFSGQVAYMRMLSALFLECPNEITFDAEVVKIKKDGQKLLAEKLKDCEIDADPDLKRGTNPEGIFIGHCFEQGRNYLSQCESDGAVLVLGRIRPDKGEMVDHAWVELSGGIVFDGITQRFYRHECYYKVQGAVKWKALTIMEAMCIGSSPWDGCPLS